MIARRILIADDHADIRDMLAMLFRDLGHEVEVVASGPAVLATAKTFRPQVVLLDIGLPRINGLDVARQLRQDYPREAMVLIAFTGNDTAEVKRLSLEAGFDYHLVKPIGIDTLETLVSRPDLFERPALNS